MPDYNTYLNFLQHVENVSIDHITNDKEVMERITKENKSLQEKNDSLQKQAQNLSDDLQRAKQKTNEIMSLYIELISDIARLLKLNVREIVSFVEEKQDLPGLSKYIIQQIKERSSNQ